MTCQVCGTVISQTEADEAAQIVGEGYETMCCDCAHEAVIDEAVETD